MVDCPLAAGWLRRESAPIPAVPRCLLWAWRRLPVRLPPRRTATPIDATLRNDASLADVFFHDRMNGWAVGDRGVIWHTTDGGTTWAQQNSNVACPLNSVFFIDRDRGWIVGGESRPYTQATRGIVLRTQNGGASWAAVPGLMLPLLTRVKFFDENVGVAIGYARPSQPSGVFVTRDGGQTWQSLPTDQTGCWLAGDFLDANTGAIAGSGGQFATIRAAIRSCTPL